MFPSRNNSLRAQQGFLIPLALFILVGLLALALAAARLTGQSSTSATLEGLSTQAFYAAESGGQYGMNQIFFGAVDQSAADANCAVLSTTLDFSTGSAAGLQSCQAQVSCVNNPADGVSFYTIRSEGSCGFGQLSAQRIIEISAFMQ